MIAPAPVAGGFLTQAYAGDPPPVPSGALGVPSLVAQPSVDSDTTRSVALAVSGPSSWPNGVLVQLQRRRAPGAFVDAALTATSTTLVLARESSAYSVEVRGFATNGGSLTDSENSGILTITVPALVPPPIPVLDPPSLALELQPESATQRPVLVRSAGPSAWPSDVRVQLFTRRAPATSWTAVGAPVLPGETTLLFDREVDPFAIDISAIAVTADNNPLPSVRSAVLTASVSGLDTVGVPLRARVRVQPTNSAAGVGVTASSPSLLLHGDSSPNVILIDRVQQAETGASQSLTAVRWRLEDRTTRRVLVAGDCALAGGVYRSVIRHTGGPGIVLAVDLVPSTGAPTRYRYATSWVTR